MRNNPEIEQSVARAIAEDIGAGDITAELLDALKISSAKIISREAAIICGTTWCNEVFRQIDGDIKINWLVSDGDAITADQTLCTLSGNARTLLSGERIALNFLQTLSATATTRSFVDALKGTNTKLLDTRKTIPGLRFAQKYAVSCGGGCNHRIGLFDAFLIKENHIASAGSIPQVCAQARALHPDKLLEIEVESLAELDIALQQSVDRIML